MLFGLMEELFANPVKIGPMTAAQSFRQTGQPCSYAHVAVVSPYVAPDIDSLYNGNRITVFMPDQEGVSAMRPDGIFVRSFSADGYADECARIEL